MKSLGIETTCSEDWNQMTPTEKGAFCQKCAKHVHDFTSKSVNEIKSTLLELSGQSLCMRMTAQQENELNAEFNLWLSQRKRNPQQLFVTALLIVFGLALFSCEDERDQRKIESIQQIASGIASDQTAKMEHTESTTIFIAPKILEADANEAPVPILVEEPEVIHLDQEIDEIEIVAVQGRVIRSGGAYAITRIQREYLQETVVERDENGVPYPTEFKALAFPNPAVESTTLEIRAPKKELMQIHLYDASGKFIREIHSGEMARGTFRQWIDLNDLNSGLYLIIVQSKDFKETVRVVKN